MSSRRRGGGFTLVELLVVISIIGMLMALLLPAVQSARETGRRNTCANNMRNVGLAMIGFENTKGYFPGYINLVNLAGSTNPYVTSYVVPLLPYLERNDLYRTYTDPTFSPPSTVYQAVLNCPSNPPVTIGGPSMAYVVNGGSDNNNSIVSGEHIQDGTCFNLAATPPPRVSQAYISTHDGSTYTLLVSENNQAMYWTWGVSGSFWSGASTSSSISSSSTLQQQIKQTTTFVWFQSVTTATPATSSWRINGSKATPTSPSAPIGINYARPSSNHTGGVNMLFCDGHLKFIAEDVSYLTYRNLMTPDEYTAELNYSLPQLPPLDESTF